MKNSVEWLRITDNVSWCLHELFYDYMSTACNEALKFNFLLHSHVLFSVKTYCTTNSYTELHVLLTVHHGRLQSNHIPWTFYIYNSTLHPPKLCACSASWGWASEARNMSRLWVLIKWKWLWSVSSWCVLLNYRVMPLQLPPTGPKNWAVSPLCPDRIYNTKHQLVYIH
jgi:hypothetical protein